MAASRELGVGIIGASPAANWATRTHIPAVRSVPGLSLAAVCTSRRETAEASAREFGFAHAFSDAREMAEHPDVDIVVVAVRPPLHEELTRIAIESGKHVFCEWPLTPTSAEAHELLELARARGVQHVVGLQGRCSPVLSRASDLVSEGFVGDVMSCNVLAPRSEIGGPTRAASRAYTLDRGTGSGIIGTAGGHTLDAVAQCVGEFRSVAATTSVLFKDVTLTETGEVLQASAPDQLAVNGILEGGAVAAVHVYAGRRNGGTFRMEINGTAGDLLIVSGGEGAHPDGDRGVQKDTLSLFGAQGRGNELEPLDVPARYTRLDTISSNEIHFNLAQLYAQMVEDVAVGEQATPDFALGETRVRLLEAIYRSSDSGRREDLEPSTVGA